MASPSRGPATIGLIVASALVAAGMVVWFTVPDTGASFGWFAYAPLADQPLFPFIIHGQRLVAAGLVVVALIIAGVVVGFLWGRRVGRVETHPGPDPFADPEAG
ncbi:hypothetical protein [Tessaracoccus antarcticus]|uniref:Uncharacterized protein n=1 Tax=Tessaracoccus antarcticus TaxID=2479848 RepID=A0A3M0G2I1_9ACTN|nr:hypothetical protein [Tessaracoccus antarcticus]RMB58778.1 hypothetical protein EAX62_11650 [Tessaracoccus antarcticus]